MNRKWPIFIKNFIRDNAATMIDEDMLKHVIKMCGKPITLDALRKIRQRMGVGKKMGRPWLDPKKNVYTRPSKELET